MRAMVWRLWRGRLPEIQNARRAMGTAVLAVGLALVGMLTAGESQACGRGADSGVTATMQVMQVMAHLKGMSEQAIAAAVPQASAMSAASTSNLVRDSGGCCGGASHATCAGVTCSWCSAALAPGLLDIGLGMEVSSHALPAQAGVVLPKSDSVFRPPRSFV